MNVLSRWRHRLPKDCDLPLVADERVLAHAPAQPEGHLVATSHGLWLPGPRRIDWHLISKASWSGTTLTIIEATETDRAGEAVILADLPAVRIRLTTPGRLSDLVHQRVTGSITSRHHQELPGGGAWFVRRRVVGRDGLILQVRPDPDTDPELVRDIAAAAADRLT